MATNDIYIPDVKTIVAHLNSLKGIKSQDIIKNIHTFESISPYIIEFYDISNKMFSSISQMSEELDKKIMDSQKSLIETINKTIDTVNKLGDIKFNSGIKFEFQMLSFKKRVRKITDLFMGPDGIVKHLNQFSNLNSKSVEEIYDDDGKLLRKTTTEGVSLGDVVKGFDQLANTLIDIVNKTQDLSKNIIITYSLLNRAWPMLIGGKKKSSSAEKKPGILDRYASLLNSESIRVLQDKKIEDQLEVVNNNIQIINSIVENIANIGEYKIRSKRINKIFSDIESVIKTISIFSQNIKSEKISGINPQINTVKSILDNVLGVVKYIIILGITFIPLTLSTPLAIGALWLIGRFVKVAVKIINKIAIKNDYAKTAAATANITIIIGLMLVMVAEVLGALVLISLALPTLIKSAKSTLVMFAIIAAITYGISWLAACINKVLERVDVVWKGLLFIIGLIGVMLLVTGMLVLFATLATNFFADNNWLMALAMFGVVAFVTVAIAGLGYLISLWLPGLIVFTTSVILVTLAIGAMLLIGVELNLLAEFNFDDEKKNKIKVATSSIISAAKAVVEGLFYGFDENDNPKKPKDNAFVRFFKHIFKGAAMIIEALVSSIVLVLTTVSVSMMILIGFELETIAKMNIDKDTVVDKVHTIMGAAQAVIDAIFEPESNPKESTGGNKFIKFLKHIFTGIIDIIELIIAVGKMALIMIAVGMVRLVGSELKWIADFDVAAATDPQNGAAAKARQIMGVANSVIDAIFNPDGPRPNNDGPGKKFLNFIKRTLTGIGDVVEAVVGIGKVGITLAAVGMVATLAKALKTINDISGEINETQIIKNTGVILSVSDQIVKKVFDSKTGFDINKNKLKRFNKLSNALDKFIKVSDRKADNLEKNINNTIKFVDRIDSVKIENLQTAANMFEKMAEFSKSISGNFEGLADVLNEKILPLLEQLNEAAGKGGNISVSTPAASGSQPVAVAGKPVPQIDYSSSIDQIRQALSRINETLTDGTQRSIVMSTI